MGVSLSATAYSSTESKEFQKHYNAVKFCIENGLSYPKETSDFFKGKIGGDDLEDIEEEGILEYIQNGVEVPLKTTGDKWGNEVRIKVSEIPAEADLIIVRLS
jgi:hypothetical protein